jgi:hypothetical protein
MNESQIQRQILLHLGSQPDIRLWRSAAGAARDPVTHKVIHFGIPGQPDLMGLRETTCPACGEAGPGQFIGIEVKVPGGSPTELQGRFGAQIALHGGLFVVAHSLEEACDALGIPLPGMPMASRNRRQERGQP